MIIIEEFNKLIDAVIVKHGEITINPSDNPGIGDFYISAGVGVSLVYTYCFDIFSGLLVLLGKNKNEARA